MFAFLSGSFVLASRASADNRAGNSHQSTGRWERKTQRFKSSGLTESFSFLSVHAAVLGQVRQ
jgi:hypothetical protein